MNIEATSLPDEIRSQTVKLMRYLRREYAESDISKEESSIRIDLWDFAGQHLYYASHTLFLSLRAIYLLVHNLSKAVNDVSMPCVRKGLYDIVLENPDGETNLENLQSWLATVHNISLMREESDSAQEQLRYLRPPVIIVGTHADIPAENISSTKLQIRKGIVGKDYVKHVIQPFFSVDNTKGLHEKECGNPIKFSQAGKVKQYFLHLFLIFYRLKVLNFSCESNFF